MPARSAPACPAGAAIRAVVSTTLPYHRMKAVLHDSKFGCRCSLSVDTVEKGKNEPIKIFACAPVETSFS
jgi:hypothetical protein